MTSRITMRLQRSPSTSSVRLIGQPDRPSSGVDIPSPFFLQHASGQSMFRALASCKWKADLMSLAVYGHPFSSYTQKLLIPLYENGTPFESRALGPDTPQHIAEWLKRWPMKKFPLLVDGDRDLV